MSAPPIVHVAMGSSAAASLQASAAVGPADVVVAFNDDLSCGRLAPLDDVRAWMATRLAYWRDPGDAGEPQHVIISDVDALARAAHVRLWVSASLSDQIALAALPEVLRALSAAPARVDVVQFERGARGAILGLGMLSPAELAHHPTPHALNALDSEELARAWAALVAPDPGPLLELLSPRLGPLPILRATLKALLSRYPDARSGVSAIERRVLRWVRPAGPRVARVLGCVLSGIYDDFRSETGEPDAIGDSFVFARMRRLGDESLARPALELRGSRVSYRDAMVTLTSFGAAVLEGRASFVDENGIDDWIAGVHLDARAGRVWVRRGAELVLQRASSRSSSPA